MPELRRRHYLVHDYAGHPFQAEMSRNLARRGHHVTHAWFAGDQGPKGRLQILPDDPETLRFAPLGAEIRYTKTNFLRRRAGDRAYGRQLAALVEKLAPDLVISGNTPTEAAQGLSRQCAQKGPALVHWCQDFYSLAVSEILSRRIPGPGHLAGAYYRWLERGQMRRADAVLHITEGFSRQTDAWGIPRRKIHVIPNWGAIDDISVRDRDTSWARMQGVGSGPRFLYSGTLALKHDPNLLLDLARALDPSDSLVVVSAGVGTTRLEAAREAEGPDLARMRLMPLQPFSVFDEVLGSADVFLAMIEPEAGRFSVPSKILSYLCAGRPVVLSAPSDNLAAEILLKSGAGLVTRPGDRKAFVAAALSLRDAPDRAAQMGAAGRRWAEENFDLEVVTNRFETLFEAVLGPGETSPKNGSAHIPMPA